MTSSCTISNQKSVKMTTFSFLFLLSPYRCRTNDIHQSYTNQTSWTIEGLIQSGTTKVQPHYMYMHRLHSDMKFGITPVDIGRYIYSNKPPIHIIKDMSAMATVCSTAFTDWLHRQHQSSGDLPSKRASNVENVSIIWHRGPLSRYAKLRVAHAPGMPGTFPGTDFKGNG